VKKPPAGRTPAAGGKKTGAKPAPRAPSNARIAALLEAIAASLQEENENPFRVRSYTRAAASIRMLRVPVARMLARNGVESLRAVPGVGEKLAALIEEYVRTGKVKGASAEVRAAAAAPAPAGTPRSVPVGTILVLEGEYRAKAARGELRRIAPRKLNPSRKAWLPILTLRRSGWAFTVMFSNTETAHRLGKTDDWVVVYAARGGIEQQCTVVTETRGRLKGRRVVRGREAECEAYYRTTKSTAGS